jgi:hypothetical protein
MGRSTLQRDFDIARILAELIRDVADLKRRLLSIGFLLPAPGVVYDTGWVAVPAAAGFTSSLQVRRIGHEVKTRGTLTPTVDWGAANSLQQPVAVGGVPAEFRSPISLVILGASGATSAAVVFRVALQSNGGIQVRCNTAAHTNSCSVNHAYLNS